MYHRLMRWIRSLSDCPLVARLAKCHGSVHNPGDSVVVAVFGHDDRDDDRNKYVYRIDPHTSRTPEPKYHLDFLITADCTVYKYMVRRVRSKWTWMRFEYELRDTYGRDVVRRIREAFGGQAPMPCGKGT